MALRDDFKEAIRTGNASEALLLAMSEALELKITTWVAPTNSPHDAIAPPGERLRTKINLIEGKIEHEVGDRFIGYAPYRELRDYHQAQVARSPELIRNNLQSLQKLFEVLNALRQQNQSQQNRDSQQPLLELSLLPPLVSQPSLPQPDLSLPSTPVIPSLRPTSTPLTPLPSLESPVPAAPVTPEAIPVPPAPEKPVSDLEIEDWEEAVGIQVTSPFPTSEARAALEDREPQKSTSESSNLENLSVFPSSFPPLSDGIVTSSLSEEVAPASPKGAAKQIVPTDSAPNSEMFSDADWAGVKQELSQLETGTPVTPLPEVREEPIAQPVSSPASSPPVASPSPNSEFSEEDWGKAIKTEASPQISTPSNSREELIKFTEETGSNGTAVISSLSSSNRLNSTSDMRFNDEEDWGDVSVEETLDRSPVQPLVREEVINFNEEDWGDVLGGEALSKPTVQEEVISFDDEEDWGDVLGGEALSKPTVQEEVISFDDEEDWGDIASEATEIQTPIQREREEIIELEDEDWGDIASEATEIQTPIQLEREEIIELEDEDWGDIASEATEIQTPIQLEREEIIELEDEDWGDIASEATEIQTPIQLEREEIIELEDEDWGDIASEATEIQTPIQREREEIIELDDEDWGDIASEATEIQTPIQREREEIIELEDEDWGDIASEATEIQTPIQREREEIIELDDEDWGDIDAEDTMLEISMPSSRPEDALDFEDEDWDDLTSENGQSERLEIADNSDDSWLDGLYDEEVPEINSGLNATTANELLAADWVDEEEEKAWDSETTMLSDLVPDIHFEDDDWGEYSEDDLDADPSVPDLRTVSFPNREPNLESNGSELGSGEVSSQPEQLELRTENLIFETGFDEDDENWVGLTEDTLTGRPDGASREFINPEAEDWRTDWLAETQTSDLTGSNASAGSTSSDDEWEEFESLDPFANPLEPESLLSDVELEEDWDDFAAEELEPYPNATLLSVDESVLEAFDLGTEEGEDIDETPPLPNTTPENGKMPPSENQS
ncbi:hypothetical protein [Oscillatoria sp. FACHB-1406]|uniref:hypothetical protein n=1 Tax=Oscillatoria sp. FACHB-1406 TaxID=2692846 RepID=UPI001682B286|nr:hypothetical protein [Oscillatoria sp. FACHB-1406]MBD2578736.1 hypothetical protein [Oscillatoria sp. FACHB-1406]